MKHPHTISFALSAIQAERFRQDQKWGEQNHPDGVGLSTQVAESNAVRADCDEAFAQGRGTWMHILYEEMCEVFAAQNEEELEAELIQSAAVCVAWLQAIWRRREGKI